MSSRSLSAWERCDAPSATRLQFIGQPSTLAALDRIRKTVPGVDGQFASFATVGRFGDVGISEDFYPAAFALFPQSERLGYGFLLRVQPSDRDRVAHEGPLIWSEPYVHDVSLR